MKRPKTLLWGHGLARALIVGFAVTVMVMTPILRAAQSNTAFLTDVEYQASSKFHCTFANEELVGGGHWGLGSAKVPPLPAGVTDLTNLVRFLGENLKKYAVWRDRVNQSVIHVADKRVVAWKNNPLSEKFTFQGVMSLIELERQVLAKAFPMVHFYNEGYHPGGHPIPYLPKYRAFKAPLHFDVKGLTLRRFLTTGIPYSGDPRKLGTQSWDAQYQFRNGKLTGHVEVLITENPIAARNATVPSTRK